MDWDLKMPVSWDLPDLEHDAAMPQPPPIAATAAAASPAAASGIAAAATAAPPHAAATRGAPSRAECSVDLKLGGLGEFGAVADGTKEPAAAATATAAPSAPSASPMKRPRSGPGGAAGAQCPSCAVDGCKADLSKCRDYHRRHKVCEAHSKTPVVVVAGREMRFCQQCSRYIRTVQQFQPKAIPSHPIPSQFASFQLGKRRCNCMRLIASTKGRLLELSPWELLLPYQSTNPLIDVSHFFPQLFLFTADCSLPFPLFKVKNAKSFLSLGLPLSFFASDSLANLSPTVTDMMNLSLAITSSIQLPEWACLASRMHCFTFPGSTFSAFSYERTPIFSLFPFSMSTSIT